MNTADRSLSAIDVALRRRFTFEEVPPEPEVLADIEVAGIPLDTLLETLNERITALLDRDHCLGHAYFLPLARPGVDRMAGLADIFRRQILPLLQEYFFEDWQRIAWVLNDHRKEDKYCFVIEAGEPLDSLFGIDVGRVKPRWRLNDGAFSQPASYQGIIQGSR
jgi:5-methylcytosine-specific restriction protein B